ncbi:expressed unknown protein [Seminavis robusta]|uniref:Uncharacterized protein n=1 Tax=Seminavis robusta TaxID=568900 RepID=A0A9N8DAF4_9STRA|nr:expressed unknown protein [Seminavis robusta]|eukprot:Sro1_g000770.1 n/a (215) ;mRNA; f:212406-213050
MMMMRLPILFLIVLLTQETALGFLQAASAPLTGSLRPEESSSWTLSSSKLFGPDEDDDNSDGKQRDEGAALAKQFYEQIKQREQQTGERGILEGRISGPGGSIGEEEPAPVIKKKKFTGKPESPPFRGSNAGSFRKTPREQMMEREFQLVGRAEKGLGFQALLAVAVAILYAYVGLTGGIQSGDFSSIDLGNDDTIVDELVLPVPRDQEASYWL